MAMYHLKTPLSDSEIRLLKVNDVLYISGLVVTARDQAHKRLLEHVKTGKPPPMDMSGLAIYHCGPVVKRENEKWLVVAAGPTTSTRMEPFTADLIRGLGVKLIIGKGGMGVKTTEAMSQYGAVYASFTGGAAVLAASLIKSVKGVEWLDLGVPEALWVFEVERFGPLIVAIDSHGRNLYMEVANKVEAERSQIYRKLGL
ncbi:MAG: FumA C-terminus/TtdB family hydratase beta subunit [Nitrososphaerota archaeon]|nr:FumA C-terminus/TtdB family hydratase beta subunit [Candidatus Bathyarchaeota archaeon]MDW8193356.1 FumA C-terminus/TtdB family hydratase beta subunit [Nitrososphaerota archaeon]